MIFCLIEFVLFLFGFNRAVTLPGRGSAEVAAELDGCRMVKSVL